jgi:hypothetical protein
MKIAAGRSLAVHDGPYRAVILRSVVRGDAEAVHDAAGARAGADCAGAGFVRFEGVNGAVHGTALAQHVPDDGQIGAEDAAEWLEDGVSAEGDVVPCEVCAAAAEDDGEADGGYDACSVGALVSLTWERRAERAYARPMQKMKLKSSFFFVWSWRCHIMGTGSRKIQMSVIKLLTLVK